MKPFTTSTLIRAIEKRLGLEHRPMQSPLSKDEKEALYELDCTIASEQRELRQEP